MEIDLIGLCCSWV